MDITKTQRRHCSGRWLSCGRYNQCLDFQRLWMTSSISSQESNTFVSSRPLLPFKSLFSIVFGLFPDWTASAFTVCVEFFSALCSFAMDTDDLIDIPEVVFAIFS